MCLRCDAHRCILMRNSCTSRAKIVTDTELDKTDRKILALLQKDARLTNNDIAERIHLSPSQCSRRRARLERDGVIAGYHARLDGEKAGFAEATTDVQRLLDDDATNAIAVVTPHDSHADLV